MAGREQDKMGQIRITCGNGLSNTVKITDLETGKELQRVRNAHIYMAAGDVVRAIIHSLDIKCNKYHTIK